MSGRVEVIRDVPAARKARVEDDYRSVGATVTWAQQANGLWTLTATFPPIGDPGGPGAGGN